MPWLTPTVFKQRRDEPLTRLPRFDDGPANVRFRHIVHAYKDDAVPENTAVQSITFETIEYARTFALPHNPVALVVVTYPGDSDLVPPNAVAGPALRRVVTDLTQFTVARPLPLLFDVLESGMMAPVPGDHRADAVEFVVLTNSDIHLQPPFYRVLAELIRQGYDAITVNRRTIDVDPGNRSFSPLFMAENGIDHRGFDCFIFPATMFESFVPNRCCCGAGGVMRSLLFNIVAHARRFLMLTSPHMTFHLGNDRPWSNPKFADYGQFNFDEAVSVIRTLVTDAEKATRLTEFINAHERPNYCNALSTILGQTAGH